MSDAQPTFTDSPEQAAVINAPCEQDMLVVAGAGSGKTYTMTRRIINLISRGVPQEKILGLTFTKKAASELLGRVSAAVSSSGAGSNHDAGANRFLKPEVLTYDAFFQSIVRRWGLLVGFDQNTQPLSEAGAWQMAVQVVDEHMSEINPQDFGSFSALVGQVLELSRAISGSMIGGDCTSVADAIGRIRDWDRGFMHVIDRFLGDEPVPDQEPKPGKLRKRTKKESDEAYESRRKDWERLCHERTRYRVAQGKNVASKRETLLNLVQAYQNRKTQLNMAEFGDFTVAAYALVSRFPSIGERLRRQHTHVLLDEYQDTSTTQAQLIAAIFHPQSAERNYAAGKSAVNAVGDPFQSIYAWRGASPGAFRLFIHDFDMGETYQPYPLSVTRRNAHVVLDAANNLTKPLRLRPSKPGSAAMNEVQVAPLSTLETAPEGTLGVLGFETLGQEIDAVARFAKAAIARHTPDSDEADGTECDERPHVAVLFRSKTTMPAFAEGLEHAGLSVSMVGYSAMLERPDVRDVLSLLHAAADHTDSAALMRLLATPRFGVRAQDLKALAALTSKRNDERRFRALVEAGLASSSMDAGARREALKQHRDHVPNMVFLADVLAEERLDDILAQASGFTQSGIASISAAGRVLRAVQNVVNYPLPHIVRTAIESLQLDIDTVVAQTVREPQGPVDPAQAHVAFDALSSLVDTYTSEIAEGQSPSLHGFVGWVDSLSAIPDASTASACGPADVVLMTIHQSKGLEWDAVAVVGLKRNGFPSNQGDSLSIAVDEEHMGGMREGEWEPPQYVEQSKTWLDNPAAVPVPVRVDADILPVFWPHIPDMAVDELSEVQRRDVVHDVAGEAEEGEGLTPAEEFGRRLHNDERRLAYVALTRARHDVLLTYSRRSSPERYLEEGASGRGAAAASNFWDEMLDSLVGRDDACVAADMVEQAGPSASSDASNASVIPAEGRTLLELGAVPPDGLFVGEHAEQYCQAVVVQAWTSVIEDHRQQASLPWPAAMSEPVARMLQDASDEVREAAGIGVPASQSADSLLERARMLLDDPDLMPENEVEDFDAGVRARGERLLAGRRQNVTSLQARTGHMSEHESREYWRALVRPIPRVSSPAAEAGTLFHAWAEAFINAYDADVSGGADALASVDGTGLAGGAAAQSRASLLAELALREADGERLTHGKEQHLAVWERRLAQSRWAHRRPFAAEQQIVVALPGDQGHETEPIIVNGKLDAVFYGGLDEHDPSKRFTVVDWKTGRKPVDPDDTARKLAQLDMYRLLLSAMEGVSLDSIDATLYYVSEADETVREIHARPKGIQEIMDELDPDTVHGSDND